MKRHGLGAASIHYEGCRLKCLQWDREAADSLQQLRVAVKECWGLYVTHPVLLALVRPTRLKLGFGLGFDQTQGVRSQPLHKNYTEGGGWENGEEGMG